MPKKPQGWKAVECASRSLTEVEKRYPQIDHKALAICWACERCYKYLIGSSFNIETDHQPLITLFNNPHSRPPIPDTEPVPANEQVPLDFKGLEVCQPSPTTAPQEESSQAQPSDTRFLPQWQINQETQLFSPGLAHDVRTQIKICKIRIKICFRIAVIRRLFTCSSSNECHLVAIFM